jgi:hypothetical protein
MVFIVVSLHIDTHHALHKDKLEDFPLLCGWTIINKCLLSISVGLYCHMDLPNEQYYTQETNRYQPWKTR